MYRTCRHIKPNGLRCKSPALKETYFCYFHSKLRSLGAEPYEKFGPMRLPSPEDPASILFSIAKITDALIKGSIEPRKAGQLLYAMQIASHNLDVHLEGSNQVESMTTTFEGEDLAPEEFICTGDEDCSHCPYSDKCPRCTHPGDENKETEKSGAADCEDSVGKVSNKPDGLEMLRDSVAKRLEQLCS
jgi:hypothetical protein